MVLQEMLHVNPDTFKSVKERKNQQLPLYYWEKQLLAANEMLHGFGIETFKRNGVIVAYYVDRGDPYIETVLYDLEKRKIKVVSLRKWIVE